MWFWCFPLILQCFSGVGGCHVSEGAKITVLIFVFEDFAFLIGEKINFAGVCFGVFFVTCKVIKQMWTFFLFVFQALAELDLSNRGGKKKATHIKQHATNKDTFLCFNFFGGRQRWWKMPQGAGSLPFKVGKFQTNLMDEGKSLLLRTHTHTSLRLGVCQIQSYITHTHTEKLGNWLHESMESGRGEGWRVGGGGRGCL